MSPTREICNKSGRIKKKEAGRSPAPRRSLERGRSPGSGGARDFAALKIKKEKKRKEKKEKKSGGAKPRAKAKSGVRAKPESGRSPSPGEAPRQGEVWSPGEARDFAALR